MQIRPEQRGDEQGIRAVNLDAFEGVEEADLVELLRANATPLLSLVAEIDGVIVGHLMCSPVTADERSDVGIMGLAPMSVLATHQRQGVGSALVREAIGRCRDEGCDAIVVLGHPSYYPRFGFEPASRFGISSIYPAPDEAFMAIELRAGALRDVHGIV